YLSVNFEDGVKMEQNNDFNAAALNAWYATKLERDKHLFSISSVGLGLLVTLATTIGFNSIYAAIMFCLAVFAFLACICAVLWIFNANADHLVKVVAGSDEPSQLLSILDRTAWISFLLGMVFSVILGVFSAIDNVNKEPIMSDKKTTETTFTGIGMDSFNEIANMRKAMQQQSSSQNTSNPQQPTASTQTNQTTNSKPSE
ncbi:hypothetical protein ACK3GY_004802, partial [Vibrio parahaemolyticus]